MIRTGPETPSHHRMAVLVIITLLLFTGCTDRLVVENTAGKSTPEEPFTVITWAGSSKGYHDDRGQKARFNNPWGIAINSRGGLYIGDSDNGSIRLIDNDQTVTTVAGRGWGSGYRDGDADEALFAQPMGVALGINGVLYVADSNNNSIRIVTPEGQVATFAGTGIAGMENGQRRNARFNSPSDLAVSRNLTVYVTDGYNYAVRKIDTNGEVSTLAGTGLPGHRDGPPGVAQFSLPLSIALGPLEQYLYVADYFGHRIRKISVSSGYVTTVAGNGEAGFVDGPLREARLNRPIGIDVGRDGTIYISDSGNHAIRLIRDNRVTTIAGNGEPGAVDGVGGEARLNKPYHLVLSQVGTFLYVSDWENHLVRRIRLR